MPDIAIAIKVDVDTERGTRLGVPALARVFDELGIRATFFFSVGPDNTGRALRRVFRPGFLKKVRRTSVVGTYGVRTLLNGVLWPGPHIGRRHGDVMRATRDAGHEVGIHCYDHIRWQDGLPRMRLAEVRDEFGRARTEFARIFGAPAAAAAAAGWQADAQSLQIYDEAGLAYASDTRGSTPFFPVVRGRRFRTLQIPTTLPTLDELMGRPDFPDELLATHYFSLLHRNAVNVMTVHAEIEGMAKRDWFREFLTRAVSMRVQFLTLAEVAQTVLAAPDEVVVSELVQGEIDGRSGMLAVQGGAIA
ncbi:polysaccharide deacetylase family protein [Acidiferrobacter sp.]|jgi:peptidoglycan/xylan/chitin deacetylase (PgdA/CDA1 family)|uniref:polysaccharide deacetylase family protein n=1 Tax=Acidiferrobacter sp. TaxID=1872107 RepID=UPI002632906E|nr:polysaccharide deacetylase family protein [Acidiferrobacter sp.]